MEFMSVLFYRNENINTKSTFLGTWQSKDFIRNNKFYICEFIRLIVQNHLAFRLSS